MKRVKKRARKPALKKVPKLKAKLPPVLAESPLMAEVHSTLHKLHELWNKLVA
jgi:hypothetical protein